MACFSSPAPKWLLGSRTAVLLALLAVYNDKTSERVIASCVQLSRGKRTCLYVCDHAAGQTERIFTDAGAMYRNNEMRGRACLTLRNTYFTRGTYCCRTYLLSYTPSTEAHAFPLFPPRGRQRPTWAFPRDQAACARHPPKFSFQVVLLVHRRQTLNRTPHPAMSHDSLSAISRTRTIASATRTWLGLGLALGLGLGVGVGVGVGLE